MEQTTGYRVVIALSLAFLAALIAFGAFAFWVSSNKASSKDVNDVGEVFIGFTYRFPKHKNPNVDGTPAMYTRPHPRRTEIVIYGIVDRGQQDLILEQLRVGQAQVPHKPIIVTFMEREVWSRDNFGVGYSRGKEHTLRKEIIGK